MTRVTLTSRRGAPVRRRRAVSRTTARPSALPTDAQRASLLAQIDAIESSGGRGSLTLSETERLDVTNLGKLFWPALSLTKGDVMRHYVRVSPYILPALAGRPLVLKRFPNGITGAPFYQHRAAPRVPAGITVRDLVLEHETRPHIVGGSLLTLLYTVQLGAISQDPWFSRADDLEHIDEIAVDLDPPEDSPFSRVRDVARWVSDVLERFRLPGVPKTSGAGGVHVYVPMPPGTSYATGLLVAQIIATAVVEAHPQHATLERSVRKRGARVYVDVFQNALGKTLASAYSVRANAFAGVSMPLAWAELDGTLTPQDFTMTNALDRIERTGDLWATLRTVRPPDLRRLLPRSGSGYSSSASSSS